MKKGSKGLIIGLLSILILLGVALNIGLHTYASVGKLKQTKTDSEKVTEDTEDESEDLEEDQSTMQETFGDMKLYGTSNAVGTIPDQHVAKTEDDAEDEDETEAEDEDETDADEETDEDEDETDADEDEDLVDDAETDEETEAEDSDYLLPDSSSKVLSKKDVKKLVKEDHKDLPKGKSNVPMAINEMYARRGYRFKDENIQAYFESKDWYEEREEDATNMDLIYQEMNDIEKENIDTLKKYR